jgi:hypothetical protein
MYISLRRRRRVDMKRTITSSFNGKIISVSIFLFSTRCDFEWFSKSLLNDSQLSSSLATDASLSINFFEMYFSLSSSCLLEASNNACLPSTSATLRDALDSASRAYIRQHISYFVFILCVSVCV